MPILFQINTCINKSTGRIAQQIGEEVWSHGWGSYIAYSVREPSCTSSSNLLPIGSKWDVYRHAILSRIFDCQGLLSKHSTIQLIKKIRLVNPDIIHLHNLHGYYLNYPMLFSFLKQFGKPVVWTLHDCWAFTGHCVHFTDAACFKWKTGCYDCPKKKAYPSSFVFDRSKLNYKDKILAYGDMHNLTIVPVSHWLGEMAHMSILRQHRIKVIQNGIDIEMFSPRKKLESHVRGKYGLKNKFIVIGVATGWSEEVGLSSFFHLRQRLPIDKYAIIMVGCTPEIMAKIPSGIVGIPRTNSIDELAALYSTADILFNGSYQETFGLVTAESLSCGTPVIVYNSTACPEIVTKDTGYIAEPKNLDQVLNFIIASSEMSKKERSIMSEKCRSYAVEHFDRREKYKEYLNIYEELLS